jgi:hypothetical protein
VRHADGTPLYFIAQIEDINDLKQTEWVNKRLMERITLANEAGGIGIWEWDLEPDIISWDKKCSSCMKSRRISNLPGKSGMKRCCQKTALTLNR